MVFLVDSKAEPDIQVPTQIFPVQVHLKNLTLFFKGVYFLEKLIKF